MVGDFISNCPLLERLTLLDDCAKFECLEINAPNLNYFFFNGIFKAICFRRTALLIAEIRRVILSPLVANTKQHEEGKDSNLIKFVCCLPAIENLSLGDNMLQFLAVGSGPGTLLCTLNCLEVLSLKIYFNKIDEVSCALCLIRSAANLRKLNIIASRGMEDLEIVSEFLKAQDFSNFSLNNRLRNVMMLYISGAHSTSLEKMEILLDVTEYSKGFRILKELARFPRGSPKAELIFFRHPNEM